MPNIRGRFTPARRPSTRGRPSSSTQGDTGTPPGSGSTDIRILLEEILNRPSVRRQGDFTRCQVTFSGEEDIEVFLEAVLVFKEAANVSDEIAFKGLPQLLRGQAGTWWRGTKDML